MYASELLDVRAAVAVHRGSYDGLADTWAAATDWLDRSGLAVTGVPWESYLVADMDGTDQESQRTEIVLPLAPAIVPRAPRGHSGSVSMSRGERRPT